VKLTVQDDGHGFSTASDGAGFGIRGMKQRADAIAANLRIRSCPDSGTVVTVRVMLQQTMISSWWWRAMRAGRMRRWRHGKTV
jgi:nitrate/nitrite-specific signal transduction histidine kinase